MSFLKIASLSVLLLSSVLLAGCGGGGTDGDNGQADLLPAMAPGATFYYSTPDGRPIIHVVNQGDAAAPATVLQVIFDTDTGSVVNDYPVPPLAPGEMSPPIRASMPAGLTTTMVTIRADSRSDVIESDESNNEDSEELLI